MKKNLILTSLFILVACQLIDQNKICFSSYDGSGNRKLCIW